MQPLKMNLKEQRKPWAPPAFEHPPAMATSRRSAASCTFRAQNSAVAAVKKRHEDIWPDGAGERGGRSHRGVLSLAATMRLLRYAKPAGRDASVLAAPIPRSHPGVPPVLACSLLPAPGRDPGFIFFFLVCSQGTCEGVGGSSPQSPGVYSSRAGVCTALKLQSGSGVKL